jgi:hypothetical protein
MWFGLFGAPIAWAAQHLAGFGVSQATCDAAGPTWHIDARALWIAITAVAALVALASEAASIVAYRRTRDAGELPPASRVHFLSVIGMTIGPLFLTIILMSGLGAALLPRCLQS